MYMCVYICVYYIYIYVYIYMHYSAFLADPGALNYCVHTSPETNDGFTLV